MTPRRSDRRELLDDPSRRPSAELARSLRDVEAVNRWLGGYRALRRHLDPLVGVGPLRILDVGAGDGATLLHLREWAPRRWSFVGVEIDPRIVSIATNRIGAASRSDATGGSAGGSTPIRIVRSDGLDLPFDDASFDAAICNLTLHHFDDAAAVALVREMARVATRKVVVNDLERSRIHHLGARLLSATVWRWSPVTRHDGPLSVRRSFTKTELEALGDAAGLEAVRVRRRFLFRVVLDGKPSHRPGIPDNAPGLRGTGTPDFAPIATPERGGRS